MTDSETRYASRKWILAAVVVVAAILLRFGDLISPEVFLELVKWTLALYFGANVVQKAAEWMTTKKETK
jgi:hypothetical protein